MKRSFVTRAGVAAIAVVLVASFPGCNKKSGSGIVDEVANSENAKNAVFKEAYELNLDFVPTTVVSAGDDQILYFSNYISDDSYAYGGPVGYAEPELTDVEVPLTADPAEPEDREGAPMKPDEGADVDDEAPVDGEDADEGEGEDEPYDGPSYTCGWAFGDKEGNVGRTVKYAPKVGDANLNDFQYLENGNIALIENHWIEQNGEYVVEQNVVILSKDGKELSRVTLQGSLEYMMESLRILSDGSAVAGTEEGIQFFAKDGKKTGKIPLGAEEYLQNILLAADGTVYAVIGTEKGTEAKPIDLNSKSLGEGIEFPSNDFYNLTVAPGHDVYSMTQSGILAYDFASKEAVQILNYLDSDMNRETVYGIGIIDATTVYVCEENLDKDDGSVKTGIYKKVDPKDVKDKTIITIGGMYIGDTALTKQIVKFNKQSSEYRIRTINYDQFSTPDDYSAGEKQFRNDVLTKSGPDIVLLSGLSNPGIYMKKKVFADLYPMMSGAGINKDDYLQNVLDAGSIDGRLYAFIPKFTVSGYVMKQSLIPGKNSVSIPEIQAMEQQYDLVGKSVPYAYRENIIYTAIYTSGKSFYDADTGKCNFDSDDFVNLLKWANKT